MAVAAGGEEHLLPRRPVPSRLARPVPPVSPVYADGMSGLKVVHITLALFGEGGVFGGGERYA